MKYQSLCSEKNLNNIISLSSTEFAHRVVKVNEINFLRRHEKYSNSALLSILL